MIPDKPISEAAKELRQRQTEAERKLWFKLRDKQTCGVKFRRQEPIGTFIVDFVNFDKKLVIEIDGSPYKEMEIKINDNYRTHWLKSQGSRVLRLWNSEILGDFDGAVKRIKEYLVS